MWTVLATLCCSDTGKCILHNSHIWNISEWQGEREIILGLDTQVNVFVNFSSIVCYWLIFGLLENEQRVVKTFLESLWQNFFIKKEVTIKETWRTGIKTDCKNYKCVGLIRILSC